MSTRFISRTGMAVVAGTLTVGMLAGCGATGMAPGVTRSSAAVEAEATKTLTKAFKEIHKAVFGKLDADSNKSIDEYEAGPNLTLGDFKKADKNRNHKVTYSEFYNYARTSLFFFKESPEQFASRFRRDLGTVFKRLDSNKDGLLVKNEVSAADLKKLRLTFEYPRLNIRVNIKKFSPEAFGAADKTTDTKLSPAEFEDLYIAMVVEALGGTPGGSGGGGEPPAPPADAPTDVPADVPADPAAGYWY